MFFFVIFASNFTLFAILTQERWLTKVTAMPVAHLFNPEHDLALASGQERFTPPAAGRGMRADLAFIPAFWADDGDIVLVDDAERARRMAMPWSKWLADVEWIQLDDSRTLATKTQDGVVVRPWGWNMALRFQLLKRGIDSRFLPSGEQVGKVRTLSHRATSIPLLQTLSEKADGVVGERVEVRQTDELDSLARLWGQFVVKAPWSSSGRGVRFAAQWPQPNLEGFVRNVILRQGSVVVEPFYEKVTDFAMEFVADGEGQAIFQGLSLFHTVNGAYVGNWLATEEEKRQRLAQYVDLNTLDNVARLIALEVGRWCKGCYQGPFGVDMMVVRRNQGFALHPCVEVNLRRTMGHVALALTRRTRGEFNVMRVLYENGIYKLLLES